MRTILHSDLNGFYASVEILKNPSLKNVPVAVTGNKAERHGVVLAKNAVAAEYGVRRGDVCFQARKKCPSLVEITADFDSYTAVSEEVRRIYGRFTDRVESFGIDECWLDVTESQSLFGTGEQIAEKIRAAVKNEIGVTVSVGVSWNKVFAKLGSDVAAPDSVFSVSRENYKTAVWPLPVNALLYVGKATAAKLNKYNIFPVGELAAADEDRLRMLLGKWGEYLRAFANGADLSPVMRADDPSYIASIGNSLTNYRDLRCGEDVYTLMLLLADSVASRLRESGLGKARTVSLSVTDSALERYSGQKTMSEYSCVSKDIADCAFGVFLRIYPWKNAVRALGISVSGFSGKAEQCGFFTEDARKAERIERAVDGLRKKYGNNIVQRAAVLRDKKLYSTDIKNEHTVHPVNFFGRNRTGNGGGPARGS